MSIHGKAIGGFGFGLSRAMKEAQKSLGEHDAETGGPAAKQERNVLYLESQAGKYLKMVESLMSEGNYAGAGRAAKTAEVALQRIQVKLQEIIQIKSQGGQE